METQAEILCFLATNCCGLNLGRYVVVSRTRSLAGFSPIFNSHRYVVRRMYICRDGHERKPTIPRRLRDRPDLQDFQVRSAIGASERFTYLSMSP